MSVFVLCSSNFALLWNDQLNLLCGKDDSIYELEAKGEPANSRFKYISLSC